ncbi:MAG TPA: hypothetical protein VKV32_12485 [Stellaceae bacterium]|nr:hypothetical protein [Stellaceae bacterium]
MWFRKHAGSGEEDYGVAAGQRYRSSGSAPILWEVGAVYRHPWEPTPHVRLHRVGMPSDMKTIALATLQDERYFAPVA